MLTRLQRILIASQVAANQTQLIATNQMYSCVRGVSGYSGYLWAVNNGLSTQYFGLIDDVPDAAVDAHISSGNGTNEVLMWYDQNGGTALEFAQGNAPALMKESDGSYYLDFFNGRASTNGVLITGNHFSLVSSISKTSFIVIRQNGSTARYFGVGHSTDTGGTTAYSGYPDLYKNTINIPNNRQSLYNAVSIGYSLVSYRDITLYSSINYDLGGYSATGGVWALGGKIKEVSTGTFANDAEHEAFESETKTRHSIT